MITDSFCSDYLNKLLASNVFVHTNTKNTRTADAERAFFLLVGSLPTPIVTQNTSVATRFCESLEESMRG